MKKLMQTSLAAMLLAGIALTATAQNAGLGKKSQEIGLKIGQEVMQEVMKEGGKPTPESVAKKMVEKMRANLDDIKKAGTEDCTTLYGNDKASNCQCVTDKTDYEGVFSMMENRQPIRKNSPKKPKRSKPKPKKPTRLVILISAS